MNLISKINNLKKKISGKIYLKENLSKYSWFNLGGSAKVMFKPNSLNDLSIFLKNIDNSEKIRVIGAGSNTLIRDGGFDGIIIKLGTPFGRLSLFDENTIIAGASTLDKKLSSYATENSISGLEFLSCIPGSIGGAIRMNTGCYGEDISKILVSVQIMDNSGRMKIIHPSNIKFSYRECDLDENYIIISATFRGKKTDKLSIKKKVEYLVNKKKKDQPSRIKTCGSTFKNTEKNKAWELIKNSGCAGMKEGDAFISEKHCNFFVNGGKAKSKDLENLINKVKKKVFKETGIKLELELQIIGEK